MVAYGRTSTVPTPVTTRAGQRGQTTFRPPEPADGKAMWALASRVGLDLNSPYAYIMWSDHHAATSVVAVEDERIVGLALGFCPPADPGTLFVWQIGVDEGARGGGVAGRMLDDLVARNGPLVVEATVTPDNAASAALFRGFGARHDTAVTESEAYGEELFPDAHPAEIRLRIPLGAR